MRIAALNSDCIYHSLVTRELVWKLAVATYTLDILVRSRALHRRVLFGNDDALSAVYFRYLLIVTALDVAVGCGANCCDDQRLPRKVLIKQYTWHLGVLGPHASNPIRPDSQVAAWKTKLAKSIRNRLGDRRGGRRRCVHMPCCANKTV